MASPTQKRARPSSPAHTGRASGTHERARPSFPAHTGRASATQTRARSSTAAHTGRASGTRKCARPSSLGPPRTCASIIGSSHWQNQSHPKMCASIMARPTQTRARPSSPAHTGRASGTQDRSLTWQYALNWVRGRQGRISSGGRLVGIIGEIGNDSAIYGIFFWPN